MIAEVQGPIARNLDKGLSRDILVILDEVIHDPVARKPVAYVMA